MTHQESESLPIPPQPVPPANLASHIGGFPISTFPMTLTPMVSPAADSSASGLSLGQIGGYQARTPTKPIRPIPLHPVPPSAKMSNLNLNNKEPSVEPVTLSLKLSTQSSDEQSPSSSSSHTSAFQAMSNGDNIISVA